MAETRITRDQFWALLRLWSNSVDSAQPFRDRLAALGIRIESDPITGSDKLSETSLVEMARAHGFYLGPIVSAAEIRRQYPWLSETEVELVAEQAQKTLRRANHVCDHVHAAVDFHSSVTEPFLDVPFLDNAGRTWVMVEARDGQGRELVCSDGLIFRPSEDDDAWVPELSLELVELHERVMARRDAMARPRAVTTAELDRRHG